MNTGNMVQFNPSTGTRQVKNLTTDSSDKKTVCVC